MSTSYVLIVFAIAIVLMIFLISKCKVNAAIGILIAALVLAIALKTQSGLLTWLVRRISSGPLH